MESFRVDAECRSCGATGLYKGMAEHDGIAVVCKTCEGTGKESIEVSYKPFTCRKTKRGILHVIQVNPGISVGQGRGYNIEDFGGQSYKRWSQGNPFPPKSEMRNFTCPAWWYQSADYKRQPHWEECIKLGSFSRCPSFAIKDKCWERFDREGR